MLANESDKKGPETEETVQYLQLATKNEPDAEDTVSHFSIFKFCVLYM